LRLLLFVAGFLITISSDQEMIYSAFKMAGLAPPLLVSKSRPQFADSNAEQMLRIFQGAVISNPGPDMVKAKPTMHHHHDCGSDNDFDDPASWNRASYNHHSCDDLESSPDVSNPYRAAAIFHLQLMFAVDEFLTDAPDARVAVVAVAVVLSWPSTRGLTVGNIATRLGWSPATLTRSIARFKTLAGLAGGGVRPGAGSIGDGSSVGPDGCKLK
jgi:hypothetical protein